MTRPAGEGDRRAGHVGARLLAAFAAVATVAMAGVAIAIGAAPDRPAPSAAANRQAAEATVTRLLAEVPLPAGAQAVSGDESAHSLLSGEGPSLQRTPELVYAHRFWRMPGEPQAEIAWMERHPPSRSSIVERGSGGVVEPQPPRSLSPAQLRRYVREHTVTTTWEATFSLPAPHRVLSTISLTVTVAAAKEGGTAVRAVAQVVWTRPRPSLEQIPADAKVITVTVNDRRRRIFFKQNVSDLATAQAIVALIEGLQRPGEGASSCPADTSREAVIRLAFRAARGAPPSVRVRINDNGCGLVRFWRGSREQPHLGEASEATKALHRLLGRTL